MNKLIGYNLPLGNYWLKKLQQDYNGTVIILESKENIVKIVFGGFVYALLSSDESGLQKRNHEWCEKFGGKKMLEETFFKILSSKFINFISEQTFGFYDNMELRHFVAWTEDDTVEIIAHYEPEIEIQKKK
ncbi:hypothetical protein RU86_GL001819 [Lactococcus piscium]|uniref:Uncharacterized protein n=1 Tax=Pseudolactococcus piscium TaxID=1364 RepID=A0A2A5RT67_9LACT|nr:hypothetical protein [Lactococcus piscium]PCS03297.1 hypothetical protein RU86_GL001819 [Lactococcus piscium]